MTWHAQKFWTRCYLHVPDDAERGVSSTGYTQEIFKQLDEFLVRHGITSMFDAGCNNAQWINNKSLSVRYQGGDISASAVAQALCMHDLDIVIHDIVHDPIPSCDLLWMRDVMIHLNNQDRKRALNNWISSGVPWLMMTQIDGCTNQDIEYNMEGFPFSETNWYAEPWLFPPGRDCIYEMPGRKMELWHRDQIRNLDCLKQQG
jgi:hypothetical protein